MVAVLVLVFVFCRSSSICGKRCFEGQFGEIGRAVGLLLSVLFSFNAIYASELLDEQLIQSTGSKLIQLRAIRASSHCRAIYVWFSPS